MSITYPTDVLNQRQDREHRTCSLCAKQVPPEMFLSKRSQCKECSANYHYERYGKGQRSRPYRPFHLAREEKWCPLCKETKKADQFSVRGSGKCLKSYCRECSAATQREKNRRFRQQHPIKLKQRNRKTSLQTSHGITIEDYNALLEKQGGRCAICFTDKPGGHAKRLYVDHDHKTGAIRGLLCTNCNTGLGFFRDSQPLLNQAIFYLQQPPTGLVSVTRRKKSKTKKSEA